MRLYVPWLLAAAATLSFGDAHAVAQSSASIGSLQLQLSDLDPSDGVDPSFDFMPNLLTYTLFYGELQEPGIFRPPLVRSLNEFILPAAPGTTQLAQPGTHAEVVLERFAGSLTSRTNSEAPEASAYGFLDTWTLMTLSAHTRLTITASADYMAMVTNWCKPGCDHTEVFAGIESTDPTHLLHQANFDHMFDALASGPQDGSGTTFGGSEDFTLVIDNPFTTTETIDLRMFAGSRALAGTDVAPPPVPEPASAALLLGGLLGLAARRRGRRA